MKISAISGSQQNFGNVHRIIKELDKGIISTIYAGNKIVGVHNVGTDGRISGMRIFEDGSFVKYSSLNPKNKALSFNVSGKIAKEIDDGLLLVKGGLVDADYAEKNPDFVMTRKGIVDALKSHLQKIKNGLKNGEVSDITGKEI